MVQVLTLCYHCVTIVLPWCYHCDTIVIPWCYHGVTLTTTSHSLQPKQVLDVRVWSKVTMVTIITSNPISAQQLLDVRVWSAAASQIFYSLGIGFGAIVSFTKNCDNIIRDR